MPKTIIMREPTLTLEFEEGREINQIDTFYRMHTYFAACFRIAMVLAASDDIEVKLVHPEKTDIFVRDKCVIFKIGDESFCIYGDENDSRDYRHCNREFLEYIKELYPDTNVIKLNKTHLEGGNVGILYHGGETFILHNNSARAYYGGHYSEKIEYHGYALNDAKHTTEELAKLFEDKPSVHVIPIEIKIEDIGLQKVREYYYHLDCFMTITPDNKVILLNATMLTEPSLATLKEAIGEDNIIDLAYPIADIKSKYPLLNAAIIPDSSGINNFVYPIMASDLLDKIHAQLNKDQIKNNVYSPLSLDRSSKFFNQKFEQTFMEKMQSLGFNVDCEKCIFDQFPLPSKCYVQVKKRSKATDYYSSDKVTKKPLTIMQWSEIEQLLKPSESSNKNEPLLLGPYGEPISNIIRDYSMSACDGICNHGSFHCLTLEQIEPLKSELTNRKKPGLKI